MITLFVQENNPLTPDFYNSFILTLQIHQLSCPCGHAGCLSVHGYYNRFIKVSSEKLLFRICRVKCDICGKTHALLLSSMVPYSQLSLKEHVDILSAYEAESPTSTLLKRNPVLDESSIRYVIRCYRNHWKERLTSLSIPLFNISLLIKRCFLAYSRQFMQIKRTINYLFLNTT